MDRQEMIETLNLMAPGQALPGTIIKQWLWINERKFIKCVTIPGNNIPHAQFREFVNRTGGVHYVFEKAVTPYIPKQPSWFSSDYKTYSRDDPSWKDEILAEGQIDELDPSDYQEMHSLVI
jgi:hypothetical protein